MSWIDPTHAVVYFIAGTVLGSMYFYLLLHTVRLHTAQAGVRRVLPYYLLRFAAALLSFWLIAQQGVLPLLLSLLGFVAARVIMTRWMISQ